MTVSIGVEVGSNKSACEDTAFCNNAIIQNEVIEKRISKLCTIGIADGVGGNAGGKEASGFIARAIGEMDFSNADLDLVRQMVTEKNDELINYAAHIPGKENMATTLTCLVSGVDGLYCVHTGNTRLSIMQGAYIKQISEDQTTYQWLLSAQQYDEAENCNRSEIIGCLGCGSSNYASRLIVQPVFHEFMPSLILMTSDGIHDYVDLDTMESVMNDDSPDTEKIKQLINFASINGSTDDKSVIIIRQD